MMIAVVRLEAFAALDLKLRQALQEDLHALHRKTVRLAIVAFILAPLLLVVLFSFGESIVMTFPTIRPTLLGAARITAARPIRSNRRPGRPDGST